MSYNVVKNHYGPPGDAVRFGCQNDGGGWMWSIVADTPYGPIGGKATRNMGHYSWGGKEHRVKDFSWITAAEGAVVPVKNTGVKPAKAVSLGHQSNDGREYFAAVAICEHGLIPGKAVGNDCWYPYGCKEHCTTDFLWLVTR